MGVFRHVRHVLGMHSSLTSGKVTDHDSTVWKNITLTVKQDSVMVGTALILQGPDNKYLMKPCILLPIWKAQLLVSDLKLKYTCVMQQPWLEANKQIYLWMIRKKHNEDFGVT